MPKVRPIDANKLKEVGIDTSLLRADYKEMAEAIFTAMQSAIDAQPTLDYEPVVHAHWIEDDDCQICSNCGEEHSWATYRASYCEDCGAKMDEEVN